MTSKNDGNSQVHNLEQLLDRISEAAEDRERVSLGDMLKVIGRRSFGPALLLSGVVIVVPVTGGIPGVPTAMGLLVLTISFQILFRRSHFWLPKWLLKRTVAREKVGKATERMRRPARFIDRFLHRRLKPLTDKAGTNAMAVVCTVVALATPIMELVPFSAAGAGAVFIAFGLALMAGDGLLSLLAFALTAVVFAVVIYSLF